ncbi:MAG TPA: DnaB-like helicase N-terminal domain-containing protein, partial [Candidatus Paceibacterota bacterium]|nr:DnaB-like helicase N-terminal domain-containing protein [Candidatus Paceibacterota bacterium]
MIDSVSSEGAGSVDLKRTKRVRRSQTTATSVDRLPPHSPEAEQGVLGCLLLAPNECIGEAIEKFKQGADVFYDLRHQTIFSTLSEMFDRREAIDVITLQQSLKDKQLLEQVGGLAYLASLPDTVPSAANISYYMDIVYEKFLLRKMIHTCTDVVAKVYDFEGEVDMLMDEVERDILKISESRVSGENDTIKELVKKAITTIEEYH